MLKNWFKVPKQAKHTLCMYRWNYLIVNLQTGMTRTCCLTPKRQITTQDIQNYGTDVFLNTRYLMERRREMCAGERHSDCQACWDLEDKGVESKRPGLWNFTHHLKSSGRVHQKFDPRDLPEFMKGKQHDLEYLHENQPRLIEINLGNTCDLKCTYCNHYYSSQWARELLKFGDLPAGEMERVLPTPPEGLEDTFWAFLQQMKKHELVQINLLGGEPLLSPNFSRVMERLAEIFKDSKYRPELGIVTNFNASEPLFDKFLHLIAKAGESFRVHVQPSIEAVEERAEYIRQNLSWDRFDRNVHKLLSLRTDLGFDEKNFYFSFQPAINTLSVTSLPQLINYCDRLMERYQVSVGVGANIVTQPFSHDPTLLTPDYKKYIDHTSNLIDQKKLVERQHHFGRHPDQLADWQYFAGSVLPSLAGAIGRQDFQYTKKHRAFIDFIERNDERRNLNFLRVFPEYESFAEHCRRGRQRELNIPGPDHFQ
jgi:organic radical activating enzyme